jgi:hypothetical protein
MDSSDIFVGTSRDHVNYFYLYRPLLTTANVDTCRKMKKLLLVVEFLFLLIAVTITFPLWIAVSCIMLKFNRNIMSIMDITWS